MRFQRIQKKVDLLLSIQNANNICKRNTLNGSRSSISVKIAKFKTNLQFYIQWIWWRSLFHGAFGFPCQRHSVDCWIVSTSFVASESMKTSLGEKIWRPILRIFFRFYEVFLPRKTVGGTTKRNHYLIWRRNSEVMYEVHYLIFPYNFFMTWNDVSVLRSCMTSNTSYYLIITSSGFSFICAHSYFFPEQLPHSCSHVHRYY